MTRRNVILFLAEVVADYVFAVILLPLYLFVGAMTWGLFFADGPENDISIDFSFDVVASVITVVEFLVGSAAVVGMALMVRIFTQIPIATLIRLEYAEKKGARLRRSVKIAALTYAIGYPIAAPLFTFLVLGLPGDPPQITFEQGAYIVGALLIFLPPNVLAAALAPVAVYRFAGSLFDMPQTTQVRPAPIPPQNHP